MHIYDPIQQKVIFTFWTGTNAPSERRVQCLQNLHDQTECTIVLVNPENLQNFIHPNHPLHKAYPYLSETHKCDYLRTYFMYHYGGGYSDIKTPNGSWVAAFDEMIQDQSQDIWLNGYRETCPESIAHIESAHLYHLLPGNCAYIVRPNTPFVAEWYYAQQSLLDEKYETLRENPSTQPDCCVEHVTGTKYPFGWNELLGRIFHRVAAKYTDRFRFSLPTPDFCYYR